MNRLQVILLLLALLLAGVRFATAAEESLPQVKPLEEQSVEMSGEDQEIVAMLELLEMLELLKDINDISAQEESL